jgi:hypothetical protein
MTHAYRKAIQSLSNRDVLRRSSAAHVVTRSDEAAVFLIETLARWAGEADSRDTEEALAWAADNQPELRARWQKYSEEES